MSPFYISIRSIYSCKIIAEHSSSCGKLPKWHRTQLGRLPNEIARTTVADPQLSNPSCQSSSSILRFALHGKEYNAEVSGPGENELS